MDRSTIYQQSHDIEAADTHATQADHGDDEPDQTPYWWNPDRQIISLEDAVEQIKSAHDSYIKQKAGGSSTRRFFFVVGAGLSYPPIPLASGIIAQCREIIEKASRVRLANLDKELLKRSPIERYEAYFRAAFPSPFQRADHLKNLMKDAKLSHANLRLAHLLTAEDGNLISELVVTTNFDELLFKSLRLFGMEPQVFSHPGEFYRIPLDQQEPVIVHLHGKVHNYDAANLVFEQERNAKSSGLQSFLAQLLAERSPLIVGYSGWEKDAFMWNLKMRLTSDNPLKANLYWFCYSQNAYEQLPTWLRACKQTFFVVPGYRNGITPQVANREPRFGAPGFEYDSRETTTLPATQVFEQLIRAFSVKPPAFTTDTLKFIAERLKRIFPDEPRTGNDGIRFEARNYFLHRIGRIINEAAEFKRCESNLSEILDNVRRSRFNEALDLAFTRWNEIKDRQHASSETPHELYDLQDAVWTSTISLESGEGEERRDKELKGHGIVCEICKLLLDRDCPELDEQREYLENRLARSFLYKGIKLASSEKPRWREAYESFETALKTTEVPDGTRDAIVGLELWKAANIACVLYHDETVLEGDPSTRELRVNEVLEELTQVIGRAKARIRDVAALENGYVLAAELEYAYVQAVFNKACLEWKRNKAYKQSLQELASIKNAKRQESEEAISGARAWLEEH